MIVGHLSTSRRPTLIQGLAKEVLQRLRVVVVGQDGSQLAADVAQVGCYRLVEVEVRLVLVQGVVGEVDQLFACQRSVLFKTPLHPIAQCEPFTTSRSSASPQPSLHDRSVQHSGDCTRHRTPGCRHILGNTNGRTKSA